MITTRRSDEIANNAAQSVSAVDLLERKTPAAFNDYENAQTREENLEEAKLRMQRNLDRLLNYEKYGNDDVSTDFASDYTEAAADVDSATQAYQSATNQAYSVSQAYAPAEETAFDANTTYDENVVTATEVKAETATDDDIRPTTTTMQFGEGDAEPVFDDMQRQKQEQSESYRLNGKGKLVVALYAIAVALILTLIVLNTGVLAVLTKNNAETVAKLSEKVAEYNSVVEEINAASAEEYIADIAENVFGMIKR